MDDFKINNLKINPLQSSLPESERIRLVINVFVAISLAMFCTVYFHKPAPKKPRQYTISATQWPNRVASYWLPVTKMTGMNEEEIIFWGKWCDIINHGITNRMNVQDGLDASHNEAEYAAIEKKYSELQQNVLDQLTQLRPPENLQAFQAQVISAAHDQILYYHEYAEARMRGLKDIGSFRNHPSLQSSDHKLWAAYYLFRDLYPRRDSVTNDIVERRLAWFDIV